MGMNNLINLAMPLSGINLIYTVSDVTDHSYTLSDPFRDIGKLDKSKLEQQGDVIYPDGARRMMKIDYTQVFMNIFTVTFFWSIIGVVYNLFF